MPAKKKTTPKKVPIAIMKEDKDTSYVQTFFNTFNSYLDEEEGRVKEMQTELEASEEAYNKLVSIKRRMIDFFEESGIDNASDLAYSGNRYEGEDF